MGNKIFLNPDNIEEISVRYLSFIKNNNLVKNNYPLKGEGLFKNYYSGHFGHVKIEIEILRETENSYLVIETGEDCIPISFHESILKAVNNFLLLYYVTQTNPVNLKCKVVGGSHDVFDSRTVDYEIATYLAIEQAFCPK